MKTAETQTDTAEEQRIKSLWTALRVAEEQTEKRGLQFGQAMFEYREKHSASGRRTDLVPSGTRLETFEEFCDRIDIPRTTAYRWIAKYEESIGTRLPKPNPDNRPSETTSNEVKVEAEPTAQASSMDVGSSEDSEPSADDLPLPTKPTSTVPEQSIVEPTPAEPTPTPTPTPVVSTEEKDREQLCFLERRLDSISIALQQVVDGKAKWSKYAEYAEVVSLGGRIANIVKSL
jgi:hypothetical protein